MHCPLCQIPLADDAQFCSSCGAGKAAHAATKKKPGRSSCSVIAIVAAVAGILFILVIAAIAIPSLYASPSRSKQKRTMGDMKTLSVAIEQYKLDSNRYPPGNSLDALCQALTPDYLVTCLRTDSWSRGGHLQEFRYLYWEDAPVACAKPADDRSPAASSPHGAGKSKVTAATPSAAPAETCAESHYVLVSAGKDGLFQQNDPRNYQTADTTSFNSDMVIKDGVFLRAPSGKQHDGPPD